MASVRTHFSIPLSEPAHAWVMTQAARAGEMPGPWLDAWILRRLRDVERGTEVREMIQTLSG